MLTSCTPIACYSSTESNEFKSLLHIKKSLWKRGQRLLASEVGCKELIPGFSLTAESNPFFIIALPHFILFGRHSLQILISYRSYGSLSRTQIFS